MEPLQYFKKRKIKFEEKRIIKILKLIIKGKIIDTSDQLNTNRTDE